MNASALKKFNNTTIAMLIAMTTAFISMPSHSTGTRLDIATSLNTVGSTKLSITAKVPNVYTLEGETEAIELSETSIVQQQQKYYTLGGVRLKFTLPDDILEGAEITSNPKFEWSINTAGKLCTDFKYTAAGTECSALAADKIFDKSHEKLSTDYEFYWEPEQWDNTLEAQGKLMVTFDNEDLPKKEIAFKLEKRELKSTAITGPVPAEGLEGDDVAMLESMLWHMGMSPSENPGARGVRLSGGKMKQFGIGTNSVALMMGRFNYINYFGIWDSTAGLSSKQKAANSIRQEMHTGKYDGHETLDKLKKHWIDYYMAYTSYQQGSYKFSGLSTAHKIAAEAVFDGSINYANAQFSIPETFNDTQYQLVKNYQDFKRIDILKAMAAQESYSTQWGLGSSPYRMTVGGYDEAGSKGFNQIKNKFSYGGRSIGGDGADSSVTCTYVSAYNGSAPKINHYDPTQNIIAKAAYMAGSKKDCGRTMYKAFATSDWKATHDKSNAKLKKMITGSVPETVATAHQDDALELLSKAIGGYNQGIATFNGTASWSEELIDNPLSSRTDDDATKAQQRKAKAIKYVFDTLKNQSSTKPDQNVLPYRTYIWEGEAGEDLNGDGDIKNVEADPTATPPVLESNEEGWCFAYGEEEWLDGDKFDLIQEAADGDLLAVPPILPIGRINCITGVSL